MDKYGAFELHLIVDGENLSNEAYAKSAKTLKVFKIIGLIFIYIFLIIFAFFAILPFYWMVITSLKGNEEIFLSTPTLFPTMGLYFSNYVDALVGFKFFKYLGNTMIVMVISTLGTLFTTILSAFAFAKLEFKGREVLFNIFLATMMIPSELFVISNYITCYRLGLLNGHMFETYLAIMLPFIVNVFDIYLLRQSFKQVPNELYFASKVDGNSDWKFLWKVMVPVSRPTIVTIVILKIISTWNAYAWPKTVTGLNDSYTLITVGLRDFANFYDEGGLRTLSNLEMAGAFIVTLPLIILFIVFRKYIMKSVGRAGTKG